MPLPFLCQTEESHRYFFRDMTQFIPKLNRIFLPPQMKNSPIFYKKNIRECDFNYDRPSFFRLGFFIRYYIFPFKVQRYRGLSKSKYKRTVNTGRFISRLARLKMIFRNVASQSIDGAVERPMT